jgi:hypothetical protein
LTNIRKGTAAFLVFLLLALLLAVPALTWRLVQERTIRSASILFDLLEIQNLSAEDKQNKFAMLMEAGVSSFFVPEYTGEEISKGVLENTAILPFQVCPPSLKRKFKSNLGTVLALDDSDVLPLQLEYLSRRFPKGESIKEGESVYYQIPLTYSQLEKTGILPDLKSMQYLSMAGVPLVYSPAPSFFCSVDDVLQSMEYLCKKFASIKVICPSGEIAAAYPYTKALGDFVRQHNLLMAQVEFSRQYGSSSQVAAAWPNIVSMHAVDREEVLKRNISRPIMLNRLFRAANEREVRLIMLRLDPLRSVTTPIEDFCADVKTLRTRLDDGGIARQWPSSAPASPKFTALLSAIALQLIFLCLVIRYTERYFSVELMTDKRCVLLLAVVALVLGIASMFIGAVPRLTGALTAGLLATEAALEAMDYWKFPLRGLGQSFLLTVGGGLILAAYFSTPIYMYRLASFSGVKLSLLLPLVLVLFLDLHQREHPESLTEILSRPSLWGELVLVGAFLLAAFVMLLRSGNYGFVSNSEIMFRDWLEKILGVRPRTKEFLIGYPALIVWYYLKQNGLWIHWREALRLAVTFAYSSAVNSFCHFHTPLTLTILRNFNGLWIGLLLGLITLIVAIRVGEPLYRRFSGYILK